jgi:cation:H+ antiporter
MTGGNRLLIGIGWPVVFAVFFFRSQLKDLLVGRERSLELGFLAVATAYVILIPLRNTVSLIDTIVLVSLFVIYMIYTSKVKSDEIELVGPARVLGALSTVRRRFTVLAVLGFSAVAIIASAEPFADSLVELGSEIGISEFVLIQWLAPLASESPEVIVAALLAWRGRAAAGMGVLISSKVNQWTLLIGTLPIAFLLSAGDFSLTGGLPLDDRQREEVFLTAAQSAFAIAVFVNLKMSRMEATALFLFATQLLITDERFRVIYAFAYVLLCIGLLVVNRAGVRQTSRSFLTILHGGRVKPGPNPGHSD